MMHNYFPRGVFYAIPLREQEGKKRRKRDGERELRWGDGKQDGGGREQGAF
jgi:hypothetical protein